MFDMFEECWILMRRRCLDLFTLRESLSILFVVLEFPEEIWVDVINFKNFQESSWQNILKCQKNTHGENWVGVP